MIFRGIHIAGNIQFGGFQLRSSIVIRGPFQTSFMAILARRVELWAHCSICMHTHVCMPGCCNMGTSAFSVLDTRSCTSLRTQVLASGARIPQPPLLLAASQACECNAQSSTRRFSADHKSEQ